MVENCTASTCDSCSHIGVIYWDDGYRKTHHCMKSTERRREKFQSSGDAADDFMREFRTFYDAVSGQQACAFYEERDLLGDGKLSLLRDLETAGKEGAVVKFFSDENEQYGKMNGKFVDGGSFAFPQEPARGERRWFITQVGKAELSRAAARGEQS